MLVSPGSNHFAKLFGNSPRRLWKFGQPLRSRCESSYSAVTKYFGPLRAEWLKSYRIHGRKDGTSYLENPKNHPAWSADITKMDGESEMADL